MSNIVLHRNKLISPYLVFQKLDPGRKSILLDLTVQTLYLTYFVQFLLFRVQVTFIFFQFSYCLKGIIHCTDFNATSMSTTMVRFNAFCAVECKDFSSAQIMPNWSMVLIIYNFVNWMYLHLSELFLFLFNLQFWAAASSRLMW